MIDIIVAGGEPISASVLDRERKKLSVFSITRSPNMVTSMHCELSPELNVITSSTRL